MHSLMHSHLLWLLPFAIVESIFDSGPALEDFNKLEHALSNFSPDDPGNINLPDPFDTILIDEGDYGPSFPIDPWPIATDDNWIVHLDDSGKSLDHSPLLLSGELSEDLPFLTASSGSFAPCENVFTFCSSTFPTDTYIAQDGTTVALRNAKQCGCRWGFLHAIGKHDPPCPWVRC